LPQGGGKTEKEPEDDGYFQLSLFDTEEDDEIIQELRELDITNLTPLAALNKLSELQNKAKSRL
jgi:DNA mismatch repair protein MutS